MRKTMLLVALLGLLLPVASHATCAWHLWSHYKVDRGESILRNDPWQWNEVHSDPLGCQAALYAWAQLNKEQIPKDIRTKITTLAQTAPIEAEVVRSDDNYSFVRVRVRSQQIFITQEWRCLPDGMHPDKAFQLK